VQWLELELVNRSTPYNVSGDTVLDLSIPDIQLNGRVVDPEGMPVAGVALKGYYGACIHSGSPCVWERSRINPGVIGIAMDGADNVYSDAKGEFSIRILATTYESMQLIAPTDSILIDTPLADQEFLNAAPIEFMIQRPFQVTGTALFSDGTSQARINVTLKSLEGSVTDLDSTDADGLFAMDVPPSTYVIKTDVESPGSSFTYVRPQTLTVIGDTLLDLAIPDIQLNGRVTYSEGTSIAGVTIQGRTNRNVHKKSIYPGIEWCYINSTDNNRVVSDSNGHFSIRILSGNYRGLLLTAPTISEFINTPLLNQSFSSSTPIEFVIQRPVIIEGDTAP
jgi:hypothetical protein